MTESGSLAPRPTPEPLLLQCPDCEQFHVDAGEWVTRPHREHRCSGCGYKWCPRSHHTVGVTTDDIHCMRIIHESHRIEAALRQCGFPEKHHATESSFDRILDGLSAAEAAGNELEEERDTARAQLLQAQRALDRLGGLVRTLCDPSTFPEREISVGIESGPLADPSTICNGYLNDKEQEIVKEAERLVQSPSERPEFDQELCRLRAHLGLALTCMRSTHEGLIHEQTDSETGELWDYCIVCDDQVVEGKDGHGGADTCVAHDLSETMAHILREQEEASA